MKVEHLAIKIENRFVEIHESDDHYDFSIYDECLDLLDGGIVEGGTIGAAIVSIIQELQFSENFTENVRGKITGKSNIDFLNYDDFCEKVERRVAV